MIRRGRGVLLSAVLFLLTVGLILATVWAYSATQLRILKSHKAYASPEEGMRELINGWYFGVSKVEIVYAGKDLPLLEDLHFVEAKVWADGRLSGGGMKQPDRPGCFFLRVPKGWVFIPEGRFPLIIALGKWLFNLS